MNLLYLDLCSGISGDMFLGAMLDLGAGEHALREQLQGLDLEGFELRVSRGLKSSIEGVQIHVAHEAQHHDPHGHLHGAEHRGPGSPHEHAHSHARARDFKDIRTLITRSAASSWVKQKAISIFHRIAVAEGKIHGKPPDQVHFHEVGAVDSIVDIVGGCVALELLKRPRVLASPVVDGTGWVDCAHGRFPVPTMATLSILGERGISVSQCEEAHELVTPTGAAILAEFAEAFGPMRHLVARRIGYGLGQRDLVTRPNLLRAILTGPDPQASGRGWEIDWICAIETNIDDMTAELLGEFVDQTLAAGALDVFHTPVQMKKNRPGVLLTLLCEEHEADRFTETMLRQTTTFGVRRYRVERRKLRRRIEEVETSFGPVQVKLGYLNNTVIRATPEFETCRKLARQRGVPLAEIYQSAIQSWRTKQELAAARNPHDRP